LPVVKLFALSLRKLKPSLLDLKITSFSDFHKTEGQFGINPYFRKSLEKKQK